MNKILKKLNIIIIFLIIFLSIAQVNVFATPKDDSTGEKIWGTFTDGWGYWLQEESDMDIDIQLGQSGAESSSVKFTERILGYIQAIGSVISVIALLIIGVRYMFSSIEEKAQMKGILIYYVIGATLVFAASNLLGVVYKLLNGLSL